MHGLLASKYRLYAVKFGKPKGLWLGRVGIGALPADQRTTSLQKALQHRVRCLVRYLADEDGLLEIALDGGRDPVGAQELFGDTLFLFNHHRLLAGSFLL